MVSISNISVAHAGSYYQRDDFPKEGKGEWHGKGASFLGLEGFIERQDFLNIIAGNNPKDGEQLVRNGVNGKHRAASDLTFSAPKSVSIAALVLGDERVIKAHNDAVTKTLGHIEMRFTQARITKNGATKKINTANMVAAKFVHHLSRETDPQLHTHCIILNATKTGRGWRAISNENLYYYKIYIGQHYRNELARNINEIGFQIHITDKGFFEIKGVDEKVLKLFSQRREKISVIMQEMQEKGKYAGMNDQRRREIATKNSREEKKIFDIAMVEQRWNERLMSVGYTREAIKNEIQRQSEKGVDKDSITAKAAIKTAIIDAKRETTYDKENVLLTAAIHTIGQHRFATLDRAFMNLIAKGEIEKAENGKYTTLSMKDLENRIMKIADKEQEKQCPNPACEKVQKEAFNKVGQDIADNMNIRETMKEMNQSRELKQEQGLEKDR